jgi:hypothetical protein
MNRNDMIAMLRRDETDYTDAALVGTDLLGTIMELAQGQDVALASKGIFLASLVPDPAGIATVTWAADQGHEWLRVAAAAAARHLPEAVSEAVLATLIIDAHPGVRKSAIESAGAVATDALKTLLDTVVVGDPLEELRDLGQSIVRRVGSGFVSDYQREIDGVTRRAKRRPYARSRSETVLTNDEIDTIVTLYERIALAGRILAPEASQLLRRYMRPNDSGVEVVPSGIYEDSPRVQAEMRWHQERIRGAARSGQVPLEETGRFYAVNGAARASQACNPPRSASRPRRLLFADSDRLKKANNRFYLQSYTVRAAESSEVRTRFAVTDCYAFEPFRAKLYTVFDVLGLQLRVEDGLGEYLTRIGKARIFTYESTWELLWVP